MVEIDEGDEFNPGHFFESSAAAANSSSSSSSDPRWRASSNNTRSSDPWQKEYPEDHQERGECSSSRVGGGQILSEKSTGNSPRRRRASFFHAPKKTRDTNFLPGGGEKVTLELPGGESYGSPPLGEQQEFPSFNPGEERYYRKYERNCIVASSSAALVNDEGPGVNSSSCVASTGVVDARRHSELQDSAGKVEYSAEKDLELPGMERKIRFSVAKGAAATSVTSNTTSTTSSTRASPEKRATLSSGSNHLPRKSSSTRSSANYRSSNQLIKSVREGCLADPTQRTEQQVPTANLFSRWDVVCRAHTLIFMFFAKACRGQPPWVVVLWDHP